MVERGKLYFVGLYRWRLPVFDRALRPHHDWRQVNTVMYLGPSDEFNGWHETIVDGKALLIREHMLNHLVEVKEGESA
jgi:hypothetical protein